MSRLTFTPLIPFLFALPATAQITVLPGDDLQALVSAAPDGTTLILESNGTFEASLYWGSKHLNLIAAPGFTPTIRGLDESYALLLSATVPPASARLQGLRLVPGDQGSLSYKPFAISLGGTGIDRNAVCELEDCLVAGTIVSGGTGEASAELHLVSTSVLGGLSLGGTGDWISDVRVEEGSKLGFLSAGGTGDARTLLEMRDSTVGGRTVLSGTGDMTSDMRFRRVGFRDEFIWSSHLGHSATLESCLLRGSGPGYGTGLSCPDDADLRAVNCTVTRWNTGIDAGPGPRFENMAIYGNGDDLDGLVVAQMHWSMIEDGTFNGFNGNFAATPLIGPSGAFLPGSPGIDAGNSSAAGMGPFDYYGAPRIQDGNGDGLARVNVGAFESEPAGCAPADYTYFNGSDVNSAVYFVLDPPVQGATFRGRILESPNTIATVLAIGRRAGFGYTLPGINGELFLDLTVLPTLNVANGTHALAVPADPALCGGVVDTQALRIRLNGLSTATEALNGAILTLGD